MDNYTREELVEALRVVSSIISRCEKAQLKFVAGNSQYTLLINRIKAMYISKASISDETDENVNETAEYTKEELIEAIRPVSSIINKCEKAQSKYAEGTSQHARFKNMIKVMNISKALIMDEISKRG